MAMEIFLKDLDMLLVKLSKHSLLSVLFFGPNDDQWAGHYRSED